MWTVLLLTACEPENPTAASDCDWLFDTSRKNNCMVRVALSIFREDAEAGTRFIEAEIPDRLQRDFTYLRVMQDIPMADPRLCKKIEQTTFRSECDMIAQRPHLQNPSGGGPRGAPPGGSAPVPPR
jgi:hypothetical protein